MAKTFRVPHRVYSEPDAHGQRRLLHAAGGLISFDDAKRDGLVDGDAVAATDIPFVVSCNVYRTDEQSGFRRLVHRAGAIITLEQAYGLKLVGPPEGEERAAGDPEDVDAAVAALTERVAELESQLAEALATATASEERASTAEAALVEVKEAEQHEAKATEDGDPSGAAPEGDPAGTAENGGGAGAQAGDGEGKEEDVTRPSRTSKRGAKPDPA